MEQPQREEPNGWRRRCWSSDAGLEVVEYALIAALLLGALLIILPQFSQEFVGAFMSINDAIADAMGG